MTDKNRGKERYEILFEKLSNKIDLILKIHKEFGNKLDEAKKERQAIRSDLTEKIEFVASSLNNKIDNTSRELNNKIEEVRVDLGRRIEGTEKRLEEKIDKIGYKLDDHEERIEVLEKKVLI